MDYKNYYDILGVSKDASQKDIRKAYRIKAKLYHPDSHPDDQAVEEKFKEVSEAYEVIGNEEKRQKYDQFGHDYNADAQGFDPNAYGFASDEFRGTANGYSDFFNMIFGEDWFDQPSAYGVRNGATSRGDIEAIMEITLAEAYLGGQKTFSLNNDGSKKITVNIPKGILSGEKLRLKGKGNLGSATGKPGDLLLTIQIKDEKKYNLEGLNITEKLVLYPWEAYLGCKKKIDLFGKNLEVKVPKNIHQGQKIRIQDQGFSNRKGQKGHLYLKVTIDNPKVSGDRLENEYEALAMAYQGGQ